MILRKLEKKDAPFMLEWMRDDFVVHDLGTDFSSKTLSDCEKFICDCEDTSRNIHLSVVDENDIYMGTVSLKNIERDRKRAEFAITVRRCAMGKGYSEFAMREIIRIGFEKERLNSIYWCLSEKNLRAKRFYDKYGYQQINMTDIDVLERYNFVLEKGVKLIWYCVEAKSFLINEQI